MSPYRCAPCRAILIFVVSVLVPVAAQAQELPCVNRPTVEAWSSSVLTLPHAAATAAQDDELVYLGGHFQGFMVVDVSSLAAPRLIADVAYGLYRLNNPTWIEPGPDVGFLGGGYGEIPVFDLSDPTAPEPIAEITLPFEVMATAYGDGRLYAATYGRRSFAGTDTSALNIFDVTDPTAPVERAWLLDNHHWAFAMEYREGILFLGASSGLHTFDVADPGAVVELGKIDLGAPVTGMEFAGDSLRAVDLFGTLHLLDVTDPTALVPLAAVDLATSKAAAIATAGTRSYVACVSAGLVVADLTEPTATPAAWPTAGTCRGVGPTKDGGIWVLSGETILGAGDAPPAPTPPAARLNFGRLPSGAAVDGSRLYVVAGDLTIIDVADPALPVVLGTHADGNHYSSIAVNGDTVYLGGSSAGVVAVDVTDPAHTALLGVLTTEPTYSLLTDGARVFVGPRDGHLQIIDAADPAAPVVLGTYPRSGPYRAYGLDFLEDRLVMLVGATTEVLDVSDPGAVTLLVSAQTGAGLDVAAWGPFVLAAAASTLKVLEFVPPATLMELAARDLPGTITDLSVQDELVHATCRQGGTHVFALDVPVGLPLLQSGPGDPDLVAVLPGHDEARCVAAAAGFVAVGGSPYLDTKGYLEIFEPVCRFSAVDDPPPPAPDLALSATPNPFNPRVAIRFVLPAPGHALLSVHDLAGRRVRVLSDGERDAGPQDVVWDGRDDGGRAVASGSYVVHMRSGAAVATTKITLLR